MGKMVNKNESAVLVGYVNITPTWTGLMPVLTTILERGSEEGKVAVKEELMRLARAVDGLRELNKAQRE